MVLLVSPLLSIAFRCCGPENPFYYNIYFQSLLANNLYEQPNLNPMRHLEIQSPLFSASTLPALLVCVEGDVSRLPFGVGLFLLFSFAVTQTMMAVLSDFNPAHLGDRLVWRCSKFWEF